MRRVDISSCICILQWTQQTRCSLASYRHAYVSICCLICCLHHYNARELMHLAININSSACKEDTSLCPRTSFNLWGRGRGRESKKSVKSYFRLTVSNVGISSKTTSTIPRNCMQNQSVLAFTGSLDENSIL